MANGRRLPAQVVFEKVESDWPPCDMRRLAQDFAEDLMDWAESIALEAGVVRKAGFGSILFDALRDQ